MSSALTIHKLFFTYDAAPAPLFRDLDLHVPTGWTGVVGPNGSGKTTLLLLAAGLLTPTSGVIRRPEGARVCLQRTDDPPPGLLALVASEEPAPIGVRAHLGIEPDWPERWDTLSHGERKRAQIAVALAASPALLAVDEPTNHLDREARGMLAEALAAYRGIGLLVSHDRELLDSLCGQCLFLERPGPVLRPGGYSAGAAAAEEERAAGRRRYEENVRRTERLRGETARRKRAAAGSARRLSKRRIGMHDSDAKGKINRARITGKDARAGRLARQIDSRLHRAEEETRDAYAPPPRRLQFWIPGSTYRGDTVARLPAGEMALGAHGVLRYPDLAVGGTDRVALCGPNGSGKSTLTRAMVAGLSLPPGRLVYLAQEIPAGESRALATRVRSLPPVDRGRLMTVVAGLGSDPRQLLATELPSPGETRKLLLGLGVVGEPWLIVMDEPTNHLDLPSIELLERALADCPCALLLVSHDMRFLDAVGCRRWTIDPAAPGIWQLGQ